MQKDVNVMVDISEMFVFIFSARGTGRGSTGRQGGGGFSFLLQIPRGGEGGGPRKGGGGGKGSGRTSAGIFGGGLNFFLGAEIPTRILNLKILTNVISFRTCPGHQSEVRAGFGH